MKKIFKRKKAPIIGVIEIISKNDNVNALFSELKSNYKSNLLRLKKEKSKLSILTNMLIIAIAINTMIIKSQSIEIGELKKEKQRG